MSTTFMAVVVLRDSFTLSTYLNFFLDLSAQLPVLIFPWYVAMSYVQSLISPGSGLAECCMFHCAESTHGLTHLESNR